MEIWHGLERGCHHALPVMDSFDQCVCIIFTELQLNLCTQENLEELSSTLKFFIFIFTFCDFYQLLRIFNRNKKR